MYKIVNNSYIYIYNYIYRMYIYIWYIIHDTVYLWYNVLWYIIWWDMICSLLYMKCCALWITNEYSIMNYKWCTIYDVIYIIYIYNGRYRVLQKKNSHPTQCHNVCHKSPRPLTSMLKLWELVPTKTAVFWRPATPSLDYNSLKLGVPGRSWEPLWRNARWLFFLNSPVVYYKWYITKTIW